MNDICHFVKNKNNSSGFVWKKSLFRWCGIFLRAQKSGPFGLEKERNVPELSAPRSLRRWPPEETTFTQPNSHLFRPARLKKTRSGLQMSRIRDRTRTIKREGPGKDDYGRIILGTRFDFFLFLLQLLRNESIIVDYRGSSTGYSTDLPFPVPLERVGDEIRQMRSVKRWIRSDIKKAEASSLRQSPEKRTAATNPKLKAPPALRRNRPHLNKKKIKSNHDFLVGQATAMPVGYNVSAVLPIG